MRRAPKPIVAVAVLALALGVVACGSEDDSKTSTPEASSASSSDSNAGSSRSGESDGGAEEEAKEAGEFKPKKYEDSGGGSKQFRAPKGYDNSIQSFGSEATDSEFEEAAASLHNFFDARAERNWAATCLYMSSSQIKSLQTLHERAGEDISCAEALEELMGSGTPYALWEEAAAIDVGAMRVDGDRAYLIYRGLEKEVYAIVMSKENGQWKVAGYSGLKLN